MKHSVFLILVLMAGTIMFTSCDDENEAQTIDTSTADLEATYDDVMEEVDAIVESTLSSFDAGGRLAEEEVPEIIRCGTRTHDFDNKIITIDFGDGCKGWGERVRKGKIVISYTDRKFMPGSVKRITFEDFYINDVKVEGIRTRTNISESFDDDPAFNITLENGKLIWPDGRVAERVVNHTRTWKRTGSPLNDEFVLEGEASGVNRQGYQYVVTIREPIRYRRACWSSRIFIPVAGVKVIEREGFDDVILDYGDGSCDSIVTVTMNGVSRELDMKDRKF